jgi:hypothetical protein
MGFAALPAALTVVLDVFWRGQSGFTEYSALMFLLDFVIVFCAALIVLNLQKRQVLAVAALTALAAYLYALAWVKYDTLGQTPQYSDLALLREFYFFYGPWVSAALAAPPLIITGLFAWNFRMNVGMLGLVVLPMVGMYHVSPHAITEFGMDRQEGSGHHYFPLPLLVGQYAAFVHSAVNYKVRERRLSELSKHAGPEVKNADLFIDRRLGKAQPRNVHVILIESLVDPAHINGFTFSSDPIARPFRAWMKSSRSRSYSPVAGNRSPDAEFEILCGLSTALDLGQVVFSNLPIRGVDCLPAKLRDQGWLTLATNSVHPHQFNKTKAYAALGFKRAYFRPDFPLDDLDGPNPTDSTVFKQNLKIIASHLAAERPVFNFILTTSTHFPFFRNEVRRPDVVTVSPNDDLVRSYANGVRYATASAAAYVEALRKLDPDALILLLGDHSPPLGATAFTTSERAGGLQRLETPLIIFDGRRGIVPIGRVPHFSLSAFIADRITQGRHCRERDCAYKSDQASRPIMGGSFVFKRKGEGSDFCPKADRSPKCEGVLRTSMAHMLRLFYLMGIGGDS